MTSKADEKSSSFFVEDFDELDDFLKEQHTLGNDLARQLDRDLRAVFDRHFGVFGKAMEIDPMLIFAISVMMNLNATMLQALAAKNAEEVVRDYQILLSDMVDHYNERSVLKLVPTEMIDG